jgi:hypothetical protein
MGQLPRDPHPNRFVWQWVEFKPVRLLGAGRSALRWIFAGLFFEGV